MKPGAFRYRAVSTVEEALAVLEEADGDVSVLAGGQSLIPLMNLRLSRPDLVLDINGVSALDTLDLDATAVRVGAIVRASRVERDAGVRAQCPVVPTAIGHIGHPQIRHRTTVGGNVAHADPSSELPGVLACLEGSVTLRSTRGTREVGWDDFFQGVFSTAREPDELLTAVTFPTPSGWSFRYAEVAVRHGDYPLAGVTVGVRRSGADIGECRLSVVGVADRPVRLREVEAAATGLVLDDATARHLAGLARAEVPASSDAHASGEYRRHVVGTLTSRLLQEVAA